MLILNDTEQELREEISALRQKIATLESSTQSQNLSLNMNLQSDSNFSSLAESLMDGFVCLTMSGDIVKYNQTFKNMIGYDDHEITLLNNHDITPPRWHVIEAQIIAEQIMTRGFSDIYEREYIRKDSRIIPVAARTHLVRDHEGKPIGMWTIIRDVSERKFSEELLEHSDGGIPDPD